MASRDERLRSRQQLREAQESDGRPDDPKYSPKPEAGKYGSPPPFYPDDTGAEPSHIPSNNNNAHNAVAFGAMSSDEAGYLFDPSTAKPWSSEDVFNPGFPPLGHNRSIEGNKSKPTNRPWDLLIDGAD